MPDIKGLALLLVLATALTACDDAHRRRGDGDDSTNNGATNNGNNGNNGATNNGASNNGNNGASNNGGGDRGEYPLGDCDAEAPCADGAECIEVDGAVRGCFSAPSYYEEGPGCMPTEEPHDAFNPTCCSSGECTEHPDGHCLFTQRCGGIGCMSGTQCVYDVCQTSAQCSAGKICVPAGTRGLASNVCAITECERDSDCTDGEGGECRLLGAGTFTAMVCTYADSACRQNEDCVGECGVGVCSPIWQPTRSGWTRMPGDGVECQLIQDCLVP